MKPVIGMTPSMENESVFVHRDNTNAVYQAGGIPCIIPFTLEEANIRQIVEMMDGLLLTGGGDINPHLFGEEPLPGLGQITPERDYMEISLIKHVLNANKPLFAICRGCQILNIAAGGNMYQDIYGQCSGLLQHFQNAPRSHPSHTVQVAESSLLHKITGLSEFKVNSYHHQAVNQTAPGFQVSAKSSDGVIEAIESTNHDFVLGVQWHPENMVTTDKIARQLFSAFVERCSKQK